MLAWLIERWNVRQDQQLFVADAVLDGIQAELSASGADLGEAEGAPVEALPEEGKATEAEAKTEVPASEKPGAEEPAPEAKAEEAAAEAKPEEAAAEATEQPAPAWLLTFGAHTRRIYEQRGFVVDTEIQPCPDGPRGWTMRREAVPATGLAD